MCVCVLCCILLYFSFDCDLTAFFFSNHICVYMCIVLTSLALHEDLQWLAFVFLNNLYIYVYLCVFIVLLTNRTVHVDFNSWHFFFLE